MTDRSNGSDLPRGSVPSIPRYLCFYCQTEATVSRAHARRLGLHVFIDTGGRLVVPHCPECRPQTTSAQLIELEGFLLRDVRYGLAPGVTRADIADCPVPGCSVRAWPVRSTNTRPDSPATTDHPHDTAARPRRTCPWCIADDPALDPNPDDSTGTASADDFTLWETELRHD